MLHEQGRMSATSRVLTLLALLAGLLAMHGLAGGAHAAHAAAGPGAHTAADMAGAGHVAGAADMAGAAGMAMIGDPAMGGAATALDVGAVAAPARHGGTVMVAMVLCLVVLLAVGAVLLAPVVRARRRSRTTARPLPRQRRMHGPRGPPPDLLSQLCVLRT